MLIKWPYSRVAQRRLCHRSLEISELVCKHKSDIFETLAKHKVEFLHAIEFRDRRALTLWTLERGRVGVFILGCRLDQRPRQVKIAE
jgi:hypothetical protein